MLQRKRDTFVSFKLTENERFLLDLLAKFEKRSVSAVLRRLIRCEALERNSQQALQEALKGALKQEQAAFVEKNLAIIEKKGAEHTVTFMKDPKTELYYMFRTLNTGKLQVLSSSSRVHWTDITEYKQ